MGKIQQMPESLANQIAAGEVVERPASVVKELVENAIDANSHEITIELSEAGIQNITVVDDGEGMDKEDLQKAFLPHATSKIYSVNDLFKIHSLGFRGEALASIGSVAKVRIESGLNQEANSQANYIEIEGSTIINSGPCSSRKGTKIIVNSLFYNTPARLKHLSSLKTELKHILNFVQNIALSYPEIRFNLLSESQKIFTSYGNGQLRQTIANVYQPSIARQLISINGEDSDFKISGFISPPTLTRTNRFYMHWIINGRTVKSFALNELLVKAYGRQLMIGRYPLSVIHIDLDPRLVDVNVHPTKQTVRLSKEAELGRLINTTIQEALQDINPIPTLSDDDYRRVNAKVKPDSKINQFESHQSYSSPSNYTVWDSTTKYCNDQHKDSNLANVPLNQPKPFKRQGEKTNYSTVNLLSDESLSSAQKYANETILSRPAIDFDHLRYVGQIHGTYLIAESSTGFYLIDQHAAQERIRYEKFMKYDPDIMIQQSLLMPLLLNFTASEMITIEDIKPEFERLGIYLETFGPNTYQIQSYPNWLLADQVEKTVRDLTELLENNRTLTINQIKEKTLIMQSCRGAIKANHYLDKLQAEALIQQMKTLDDPYHCPHGRPVFVEFDQNTLEKLFKRIQDSHERGTGR